MTRRPVIEIAAFARDHGWTVVLGGPESANYPAEYLSHGASVIVTGEGEETMAELLPALALMGPHRLHGVAGTVFRDETAPSSTTRSGRRSPISIRSPGRTGRASTSSRYVDVWRTHHGMGKRQPDHGPRLPLQVPLVLACRLRLQPPPPQCRRRGGGDGADPRPLAARSGLVCGRRLHHQSHRWLFDYRRRAEAAEYPPAFRNHFPRRSHDEGRGAGDPGGAGLLPHLDRLGERQPAHPRRDGARRHGGAGAVGHPSPRSATAFRWACSSCGVTKARPWRTWRRPSST